MLEIQDRLDILRRALDKLEEDAFRREDSALVDHAQHMKNELQELNRVLIEETIIPYTV